MLIFDSVIKPRRAPYGEPETWNLGAYMSYGALSFASDGTTLLIGIYSNSYAYTDDFSTFNYKYMENGGVFYAAGAGDGYWALGAYGKVFVTDDLATTPTQNSTSFDGYVRDVHYGSDGYWVAVTQNGKIYTATDPTGTWTENS